MSTQTDHLPSMHVFRNTVYHFLSASNANVCFYPHHSPPGSNYPVVYQCSREAWTAGILFGHG